MEEFHGRTRLVRSRRSLGRLPAKTSSRIAPPVDRLGAISYMKSSSSVSAGSFAPSRIWPICFCAAQIGASSGPSPPTVALVPNPILPYQYRPQQQVYVPPYYPVGPPPGAPVAAPPFPPVYPAYQFTFVFPPPPYYLPAPPAALPMGYSQFNAGHTSHLPPPPLPLPTVAPSQAQAVPGGSHVVFQSVPQTVHVPQPQPNRVPTDDEELIWCGRDERQRVGNRSVTYRCSHLVLKTEEAIENHYALVHGTNLHGKEKCGWGGGCQRSNMLGHNIAGHIWRDHITGGMRLCEGKGCRLQRAAGSRWCTSSNCEHIPPVWGNREPTQQFI